MLDGVTTIAFGIGVVDVETVIARLCVATRLQESVACTVNVYDPACVGVPDNVVALPEGFNVSPFGSEPATTAQFTMPPLNGLEKHAPVVFSVCVYAVPTVPPAMEVVVI
jgi:hypothetical protein